MSKTAFVLPCYHVFSLKLAPLFEDRFPFGRQLVFWYSIELFLYIVMQCFNSCCYVSADCYSFVFIVRHCYAKVVSHAERRGAYFYENDSTRQGYHLQGVVKKVWLSSQDYFVCHERQQIPGSVPLL